MKNRLIVAIVALWAWGVVPAWAGMGNPAFWRSLLVPGWGQWHAGERGSGLRFFTAELVLWGGYFAFQRLEDVREDEYERFAAEHAHAQPRGKGDSFFDDLGFYESWLQYNQYARYEEGPEADLYPAGPDFFWEWDQSASRLRYRELRNSSERAHRRALYATGLVLVNHLISAIHAARISADGEREPSRRQRVEARFDPGRQRIDVRLVRSFP